jgi:hypothetical protein
MRKDFQVLIPFRGDRNKSTSSLISRVVYRFGISVPYEPFGIFLLFLYRIPEGNSVGKLGILKLVGATFSFEEKKEFP